MSHTFALLVPVKTLTLAKSRLVVAGNDERQSLMRAFALDAIAAASQCPAVAKVYVVTDEPGFEVDGAVRLDDEGDGDLNRALQHASLRARLVDPTLGVAAMCADLPSLTADDLGIGLDAGLAPRWFVADASGSGTTLLAAGPGMELDPHFGGHSAHRHEQSGAAPVRVGVPTLRQDVDTEADLVAARQLGVGTHTSSVLGLAGF